MHGVHCTAYSRTRMCAPLVFCRGIFENLHGYCTRIAVVVNTHALHVLAATHLRFAGP